ncbi:integrin alpha-L-like [Xiphias gladius]|uniref:integrin alpha-L-like n=1 Tax=Xiphias gladius TaxID=8245 RepID=UPI001A98E300|nr:integrin alpha-L-like [Xiphias gladius]
MAIASQPADKYVFKIEDYNGLTGILENFQKKILKMEAFVSLAFNIDTTTPNISTDISRDKVLNFMFCRNEGILVTEPQQLNRSQETCLYDLNQTHQCHVIPECTKKTVDLVFLFDGSGSMTEDEFTKNKDFIVDIMNSLKNTSIKFAAVQFSSNHRKVFDFNDYQAGSALDRLHKEPHMKSLTNTHRALKFVLDNILENPVAGASPDATKVLVLITDGDPSDTDRDEIIKRYDKKNIIRFVIGVKVATLDKFMAIASQPADKYVFKIEDYNGLTGILENFQKKILKMEGYTTAIGEKNNAPLYFMGAPRFKHTGQVILFKDNGKNWTAAQRLNGDQIGSYFGAELCAVDINSDGNTDFLLVGAPLFYQPQEKREGQIYVYTLTDEMRLESELNVTAPSMGRFGNTISSLADLNGDGLRDVAVGAPLEDDNRGAVYIYLGDRYRGICSTFSQRIRGKEIEPWLRFFGQAIHGDIDLEEDGLPDIVIGSQGTAVVLRSRPVFKVLAHLSFQPEEISTEKIDCLDNTEENVPMVTLTTCFEMVETTKSKAGTTVPGLTISYTLDVDPTRQRGFFNPNYKEARNLTSTYTLRDKDSCFSYSIYMPKCVEDILSPISIRLNFFQVDSENASAFLSVDSKRQVAVEVPFKK